MTPTTDTDMIAVLQAADPAAAASVSAADAVLAVRNARPQRKPRRSWAVWAAVAVIVAGLGVPAAAGASGFIAHTGWFGSPNPGDDRVQSVSTESDDTEWLDFGAPDINEVVASLYPQWLPLAPGATRESIIARVESDVARQSDGLGQVTLVKLYYETAAYHDWIDTWNTAHRNGDARLQTKASTVLTAAASWPAMVASDGGGVVDVMRAFARRLTEGDADAAQALAQMQGTPSWDGVDRQPLISQIMSEVMEHRK